MASKRKKAEAGKKKEEPKRPRGPPEKLTQGALLGFQIGGDKILSCGAGDLCQLGTGRQQDRKPRRLDTFPEETRFRDIAAGGLHSVALTTDGKVYTWGCNDDGPLGRECAEGDEDGTPALVAFPHPVEVTQVVAGATFTAALANDGRVFVWGGFRNAQRMAGLSQEVRVTELGAVRKTKVEKQNAPREVDIGGLGRGETAVKLAGGENHLCILTSQGRIFTMGNGDGGQLGRLSQRSLDVDGRTVEGESLRACVVGTVGVKVRRWEDVWCGANSTFARGVRAVGAGRSVVCAWGTNSCGKLGLGQQEAEGGQFPPVLWPTEAAKWTDVLPQGSEWVQFSGDQHTLAVTSCGRVFGLGRSDDFILGDVGGREKVDDPLEILVGEEGEDAEKDLAGVSTGNKASFCWNSLGHGFAFGHNSQGELGLGLEDDTRQESPRRITSKHLEDPDQGVRLRIVKISAGAQHTLFLGKQMDDQEES